MSEKQAGFSLIELLTVIIIASILLVFIGNNLGQRGLELQASRDDVVTALFQAQQIAMARQSSSNPVQFISSGSSVDIQENGASVEGYPLPLPPGVSLSATTLEYDKLGRTSATVLSLNGSGSSTSITVETSGYAH